MRAQQILHDGHGRASEEEFEDLVHVQFYLWLDQARFRFQIFQIVIAFKAHVLVLVLVFVFVLVDVVARRRLDRDFISGLVERGRHGHLLRQRYAMESDP